MTTALDTYLANATSTTLGTAKQLYAIAGSDNSGNPYTSTHLGASGWGQVWAFGTTGTWAGAGSLPDEDGHGFILENSVVDLQGKQFPADNWTPKVRLTSLQNATTTGGTINCDICVRYSVRRSGGAYETIVTSTATNQTVTSTVTTFTLPATAGVLTTINTGDVLYEGIWLRIISLGGGATYVRLNRLSNDTSGKTGDPNTKTITPGYNVSKTRTVPLTASFSALARVVPLTASFSSPTISRYVALTAAFALTQTAHITPASSITSFDATSNYHLMLYNDAVVRDMCVSASFLVAEDCGVVARCSDSTHFYVLRFCDNEGGVKVDGSNHNVAIELHDGGTVTSLVVATVDLKRADPHLVLFDAQNSLLTGYIDGVQVIQAADTTLVTAGKGGYRYKGAASTLYSMGVIGEGADLSSSPVQVKTRVTLLSDDPLKSPIVRSIRVEARDRSLVSGAVIPSTSYNKQKKGSEILDDIATLSHCSWRIKEGQLSFIPRPSGRLLPWLLTSDELLSVTAPQLIYSSPLYHNRHKILNAFDTIAMEESRMGDGVRRSWIMTYALDSEPVITVGGTVMTVGVKEEQTGRDFYWHQGSKEITQDKDGLVLTFAEEILVAYIGQTTSDVIAEDFDQQAILATVAQSSGIIEVVEDARGLSVAAAQSRADAIVSQQAKLARTFTCVTERKGASAGMLAYVFIPEYGLVDGSFFITEVRITPWEDIENNLHLRYNLKLVEGPNVGSWSKYFQLPT